MRPYLNLKRTFIGNDWFGKIKNFPYQKIRNKLLRKYPNNNAMTEICLPTITSRTTIKNQVKKRNK